MERESMIAPGPIVAIMFLNPLLGASGKSPTFQSGRHPAFIVSAIFFLLL
jgi:hypothetical protein